jgi:integrase
MSSDLKYWTEYFEKSKNEMLNVNFEFIRSHVRKMRAANRRESTFVTHYQHLTKFGVWCKKPFTELTQNDMLDYFDFINDKIITVIKDKPHTYKESTKYTILATVKAFLKDINNEASKALTLKPTHARRLPEDLLTKEEVEAMLDNCLNSRDRALLSTLYESGMRKGELFSIKLKNVHFDENGTVITIPDTKTTKTGARRIRIVFATEHLKKWLNDHPRKNDREHILFCSFVYPYNRLTDAGLTDQLKVIAKKAGIQKRFNPHSFRHARATHLANHMTEQQMKKYLGWTEGSSMASVYVHLSGKDIDDAVLKMNGIDVEVKEEDKALRTLKCPRCGELQDARNKECCKCWVSLVSDIDNSLHSEVAELKEELARMKAVLEEKPHIIKEFEELYSNPSERKIAIDKFVETSEEVKADVLKDEETAAQMKETLRKQLESNIDECSIKVVKRSLDKLL